jgi:hypothetical protein
MAAKIKQPRIDIEQSNFAFTRKVNTFEKNPGKSQVTFLVN